MTTKVVVIVEQSHKGISPKISTLGDDNKIHDINIRENDNNEKRIIHNYRKGLISLEDAIQGILTHEIHIHHNIDPEMLTLKISDLFEMDDDSDEELLYNALEEMYTISQGLNEILF